MAAHRYFCIFGVLEFGSVLATSALVVMSPIEDQANSCRVRQQFWLLACAQTALCEPQIVVAEWLSALNALDGRDSSDSAQGALAFWTQLDQTTSYRSPEQVKGALEGVAYSLEAKALGNEDAAARQSGLELALQAFVDLQPSEGGPMRDYSLYHQGRVLVALGKPADGIAKYKQLLTELPDSSLTPLVEARLESIDTEGE